MKKFKGQIFLGLLLVVFTLGLSINVLAYTWSSNSNSYSTYRSSSSSNGYYSSKYYSNNNTNSGTNSNNVTTKNNNTTKNNSTTQVDNSATSILKYGMKGSAVRNLQQKLDRLGYDVGGVSGYYKRETTLGVMYFQRDNGLKITGKVDSLTMSKINSVYTARFGNSSVQQSNSKPEVKPEPKPVPEQPTQEPENNSSQSPSENLRTLEEQMLSLVNQARTAQGLKPLQMDSRLVGLARKKSQDMIDNNYFSHSSPTYGSTFKMLNDAGISYRTAGENIASNNSVGGAHRALMNSSGHKKNILNPAFTKIGIGIKKGGSYGMMFTQIFIG